LGAKQGFPYPAFAKATISATSAGRLCLLSQLRKKYQDQGIPIQPKSI